MQKKVYINKDFLESITVVLREEKSKNIFLVTGKKSFELSGAKKVCDTALKDVNVTHFVVSETLPCVTDIKVGISSFNKSSADIIIAVGGGSVIDTAKAINTLSAQKTDDEEGYITGKNKLTKKRVSLVAVPTTAGSGSEATHFAVVYIKNKKYSLSDQSILPDFVIVDPTLTHSLPKAVTASSGLDALAQGIESYWSVKSNKESKEYAKKAIELSIKYLVEAVQDPNPAARLGMSEAAYFAGKAINISKTTAAHAMSYPLSVHFGIAHGHAVALTLPYVFLHNSRVTDLEITDTRGVDYVKESIEEIISLLGCDSAEEVQDLLRSLITQIGLQKSLSEFGISKIDINLLSSGVSAERMGNNPSSLTEQVIKKIYTDIM